MSPLLLKISKKFGDVASYCVICVAQKAQWTNPRAQSEQASGID